MVAVGPDLHAIDLPRTLFAPGASAMLAEEIEALGVHRPLLVTDRGLVAAGLVERVTGLLAKCAAVAVFDGVTENPVFADADCAAVLYARAGCDGIVALGGGSVIDVAKFTAVLAANGGRTADYAGVPGVETGPTVPLVVLPTTAGTGSEANGTAGIHAEPWSVAVGIFSRHILPRLVILDPELTVSLPPRLTAATGIDALSHCIEGYFSRNDPPLLNGIALDGAARAPRFVRRAVANGTDIEARAEMMIAAYAGGVAIGMGLGPAHAIAVGCGDQNHQHGILSGIGLVATLDIVEAQRPERATALKMALGLDPGVRLAGVVADLMRELALPATLRELGYVSHDLEAQAVVAHESFFNRSAFYRPRVAEYREMLAKSLS